MDSRNRVKGGVKRRRGAERRSDGRVGVRDVLRRIKVRRHTIRMPADLEIMGSTPS